MPLLDIASNHRLPAHPIYTLVSLQLCTVAGQPLAQLPMRSGGLAACSPAACRRLAVLLASPLVIVKLLAAPRLRLPPYAVDGAVCGCQHIKVE